ncbi:MAG: hypothetical protein ACJAXA_002777 [Candidatus Aldehydirespiratoraceae bacterium]|jgi:hypothetical protein
MTRRRRPGSRTSVADGRAELIIPLEAVTTADGGQPTWGDMKRWMSLVGDYPAPLRDSSSAVALVVDGFAYDLHLGDVAHTTDTHDGVAFRSAAVTDGVAVYVAKELDPRRSKPVDFIAAAKAGQLIGARVAAFKVDALPDFN